MKILCEERKIKPQGGVALAWAVLSMLLLSMSVMSLLTLAGAASGRSDARNDERQAYLTSLSAVMAVGRYITDWDNPRSGINALYGKGAQAEITDISLPEDMGDCSARIIFISGDELKLVATTRLRAAVVSVAAIFVRAQEAETVTGWELLRYEKA